MLNADEIQSRLASCPGWTVVTSPLPDDPSKTRTELHRVYRFASFDGALAFMQAAAPFINRTDHHPRWENAFKTLKVWLSTWDSGHVISEKDFELATHLNQLWDEREQKR
jgi:pterin-4a-carbinolamine dehydratase